MVDKLPSERTAMVNEHWKMLEEELKVSLDIKCYNALLKVYLDNGHSFNPMEFVESMESKNIQPNRVENFPFTTKEVTIIDLSNLGNLPATHQRILYEWRSGRSLQNP